MQVEWEEYWWEASDWAGMKEMGAEKSGCSAQGAAWRETWKEALTFDHATGEPVVDRTAHKWAHDEKVWHGVICLWEACSEQLSGRMTRRCGMACSCMWEACSKRCKPACLSFRCMP